MAAKTKPARAGRVPASVVYGANARSCTDQGVEPVNAVSFGRRIAHAIGPAKTRIAAGVAYLKVRLIA